MRMATSFLPRGKCPHPSSPELTGPSKVFLNTLGVLGADTVPRRKASLRESAPPASFVGSHTIEEAPWS